jgi:DnaK suppressor protein
MGRATDLPTDIVNAFRRRLAARLELLRGELAAEREGEAKERLSDLAGEVAEPADLAASSAMVELENDQIGRIIDDIRGTEAAIERIARGEFGRCIDCGEPIARARLDANPSVSRCVPCQSASEKAAH